MIKYYFIFLFCLVIPPEAGATQLLVLGRGQPSSRHWIGLAATPDRDVAWRFEADEGLDFAPEEASGLDGSSFVDAAIRAPVMDRADLIAAVALGGSRVPDPIADFLARPAISSVEALDSSSRAGPAGLAGLAGSPGRTRGGLSGLAGPGGPMDPGGPTDPGEPDGPGEAKAALNYATASLRAVVLTLSALGLLWWRLDREAR